MWKTVRLDVPTYLLALRLFIEQRHNANDRLLLPHIDADVEVASAAQRCPSALMSSEFLHALGHFLRTQRVAGDAVSFCIPLRSADGPRVRSGRIAAIVIKRQVCLFAKLHFEFKLEFKHCFNFSVTFDIHDGGLVFS